MSRHTELCFMVFAFLLSSSLHGAISIYGRQKPGWTPGVTGGIPVVAAVTDVKKFGATGNGTTNDLAAFQSAINSVNGTGAVYVPEGTYALNGTVSLRSGVVLRGAGADKTHLKFNASGYIISIASSSSGSAVALTGGYTKGSSSITVSNASSFSTGALVEIQENNDPAMITRPDWNASWANNSVGQIVKVTAINGNTLALEEPLRETYKANLNPRARRMNPIRKAGIEYLKISRLDRSDAHGITFAGAHDCWMVGCEAFAVMKSTVFINACYRVEIRDSYLHDATDLGGGGHGYGVEVVFRASSCLIENNIFKKFRHSTVVHNGANGNVFAYNYSREPTPGSSGTYPDISIHGHWAHENLYESNVMTRAGVGDWWGPCPNHTLLRNRFAINVFVEDYSNYTYVMGNELPNGRVQIDQQNVNSGGINRSTCIFHGNYESGTINWESGIADRTIPPSYYLNSKPAFFGSKAWPILGSDVRGQGTIPAEDRWNAGKPIPDGGVVSNAVTVVTATLPTAAVGLTYSTQLSAHGGTAPYAWSIASGNFGGGLSLKPEGRIEGTPLAAGDFTVSVKVTDAKDSTALKSLTLRVAGQGEINLATAATTIGNSGNFAAGNPVTGFWDGNTSGTDESGWPGSETAGTIWVEYDLGRDYRLSSVRFFGDDLGTWVSETYTVEVKTAAGSTYQPVVNGAGCKEARWFETGTTAQARYVKLTVTGAAGLNRVQAREFEVFGTRIDAVTAAMPAIGEVNAQIVENVAMYTLAGRKISRKGKPGGAVTLLALNQGGKRLFVRTLPPIHRAMQRTNAGE